MVVAVSSVPRWLSSFAFAGCLLAPASGQCFAATGVSVVPMLQPLSSFSIDDEGETPEIAFNGFTFPMGGVGYTHFAVNANGELYLTLGNGVVGRAAFGIDGLSEMLGAGGSPRVCALGGDAQAVAGLVGWDILVDQAIPGEVSVTWTGMRAFGDTTGQAYAMRVTLRQNGEVDLTWDTGFTNAAGSLPNAGDFAGLSDASGSFAGPAVLGAGGDSGAIGLVYQHTWLPWDLDGTTVRCTPNGIGGYTWAVVCAPSANPPASHAPIGVGCYDRSTYASVYQFFASAVAAEAGLANRAFVYQPDGFGGQQLASSTATMRGLAGATMLNLGDDAFVAVTPSVPFPYLGTTPMADLHVSSNGFVCVGAADTSSLLTGPADIYNGGPNPAYCAWGEDLDPSAPGSGGYWYEEAAGVLYITADAVYHQGNDSTVTCQWQFDLSSGAVTIVYGAIGLTTEVGDKVVGFKPGGPVADMGGIDFASDLPYALSASDVPAPPLGLAAAPPPVSTAAGGTTVAYTITAIPEAAPASGIFLGGLIVSVAGDPVGTDLGFLGAAGCRLYVGALDLVLVDPAQWSSPMQSLTFAVPAGVPAGESYYGQAFALTVPGLANAFGGVTSNGIESLISDH